MNKVPVIFAAIFLVIFLISGFYIIIEVTNDSEIDEMRYSYLYKKLDSIDKKELQDASSDGKINHNEYYYLLRDRAKTSKQLLLESVK